MFILLLILETHVKDLNNIIFSYYINFNKCIRLQSNLQKQNSSAVVKLVYLQRRLLIIRINNKLSNNKEHCVSLSQCPYLMHLQLPFHLDKTDHLDNR